MIVAGAHHRGGADCPLTWQVLIIVVVLSMALTPGLAELGKVAGDFLDATFPEKRGDLSVGETRLATEVKEEEAMLMKKVGAGCGARTALLQTC